MAERYRPITQYDEQFEDKEVEQSEKNRDNIELFENSTSYNPEDLLLLSQEDAKTALDIERAAKDPQAFVSVERSKQDLDIAEGKVPGGNLLGHGRQQVVYNVQDIMNPEIDKDGSLAASIGLPRDLRKNWNVLTHAIDTIRTEKLKGQNLESSINIKGIREKAANQERELTEDEIEEIAELEADIQENLEGIESNEAQNKDRERIIGEYWLNQLEEDKQRGGGFFGLNSISELADSLGGSYSEIATMAQTYAAGALFRAGRRYAVAGLVSAGTAATGYTVGTGGSGIMGPQAIIGAIIAAGGFLWGVASQYNQRSAESYAEMYGAYDSKVAEDINHFKLVNGREPNEEEIAKIKSKAEYGIQDVYEQNMALLTSDAIEMGLAFVPWWNKLRAVGKGVSNPYLRKAAQAGVGGAFMVGGGISEQMEEGYQHLIQENYQDGEYGEEGFWRAVGNSIGTYGETGKGVALHALTGLFDYRAIGTRTASSGFRAAANSGMALGLAMGGGHAAAGKVIQKGTDQYNLQRYGGDVDLIMGQFGPQAVEDRIINEEQRVARLKWLFEKTKEGKGNFLNKQGIRRLAKAYQTLKQIDESIFEGIDEGEMLQSFADAEHFSDLLSEEKFSDLTESGAENAFIQLMRFSEVAREQKTKLSEASTVLQSEIDGITETDLVAYDDEQKDNARRAMILKSKLGTLNALIKAQEKNKEKRTPEEIEEDKKRFEFLDDKNKRLNLMSRAIDLQSLKQQRKELQKKYDSLISESGLSKNEIRKKENIQGAYHQVITHSQSGKLANYFVADMLQSSSGKALENHATVQDFKNNMEEVMENAEEEKREEKEEQEKIVTPDGSNDLKNGDEAYYGGKKGRYREIGGEHYFVPEEFKDLNDGEIALLNHPEVVKLNGPQDLSTKKTKEKVESETKTKVKKAKEKQDAPADQQDSTLENVEEKQEEVNEEANEGLEATEGDPTEDEESNSDIVEGDSASNDPSLKLTTSGARNFSKYILSKIRNIFIDKSINVAIKLNNSKYKKLETNAEELKDLAKALTTGVDPDTLTEKQQALLDKIAKEMGSLLYLEANPNAKADFIPPTNVGNKNLILANYVKILSQVIENRANKKESYVSVTNPSYGYNNINGLKSSVQSLFTGNQEIQIGISNGNTIIRGNDPIKALRAGVKGRIYAVVNGITVKLNHRNLNEQEAEILFELLTLRLQAKGDQQYQDSGLTVMEYINLLVPTYSAEKAKKLSNTGHSLFLGNNSVQFGDQRGQIITEDNIEAQKENFLAWAQANKKRRIQGKALGKNMFQALGIKGKEKIVFLGQEYTNESKYDDVLYAGEDASNHVISTDVKLIDGSPISLKYAGVDSKVVTQEKKDDTEDQTPKDPEGGAADETGDGLFMDTTVDPNAEIGERVNQEEAKKWLLKILGPSIPIEFTPVLIRMANMDGFSYGKFHAAMITLSMKAPAGVEYHEAYHAIEELFLTDKEIQSLLEEGRKKYPKPSEDVIASFLKKYPGISRNTAERIYYSEVRAEDYRMYELGAKDAGLGTKTLRWFKMLKGLVTYIFTNKMTADLLFHRISSGFYAKKGPRPDKVAMWKRNDMTMALDSETKNPIPERTVKNTAKFLITKIINLPVEKGGMGGYVNINNLTDFQLDPETLKGFLKEVKRQLKASKVIPEKDKAYYRDNIDSIADLLLETTAEQEILLQQATQEYELALQQAELEQDEREASAIIKKARRDFKRAQLQARPTLVKEMIKELMLIGIEERTKLEIKEGEQTETQEKEAEAQDEQNKDVVAATKHSYESSNKDNATVNTKMVLNFLFQKKFTKDRGITFERDPYTGIPVAADFSSVWNTLEEELANIVQYAKQGKDGVEYVFVADQMRKKIKELAKKDPTFGQVTAILKNLSQNEQIQFFEAFSKSSNNFLQSQKENKSNKKNEVTKKYRFFNPLKNSKKFRVFENWLENIKDVRLYNENISEAERQAHARKILKAWINLYTNLFDSLYEDKTYFNAKEDLEKIERLSKALNTIGINIDSNALLSLFNSENSLKENRKLLSDINMLFTAQNASYSPALIAQGKGDFNYDELNPIKGEKRIVLKLAQEASRFNKDYGQNTIVGATGSSYWGFSPNHFLKKRLNQFKSSAAYYVGNLRESLFHKDSLLLDYLEMEEAEVEARIFSGFKLKGAKEGKDYTDLSAAEERSLRINMGIQDIFIPMTPADKGSWNIISGFKAITLGDLREGFEYNKETDTYILPEKVKKIFSRYAITELKRMAQTHVALFGENALPNEKLVQHYHYRKLNKDGTPNRKTGNGLKSQIFTSFNDKKVLEKMGILNKDGTIVPTDQLMQNEEFNKVIDNALNSLIKTEIEAAKKEEIIKTTESGDIASLGEIDTEIGVKVAGVVGSTDKAVRMMIAKYALSGTIANVETLKVFSGDPAFYKNMPDLSKRIPGIIAPGKDLIISSPDEVFYRAAVLQDVETGVSKEMREEYAFNLRKEGYSEEEIDNILAPYDDYSVTDAQGWITLDRWRFLNEKLGRFDPESKEHVAAFDRLKEGKGTKEDIKFIQAMPMKGMHFELRDESNLKVPTYIKYSQAVLIPQFTKGRELNNLLKAMIAQKVDEVIVDSGVKAGALSPIDITGVTTSELISSDKISFNVMTLKNEYWKLQQDLSPHEKGGQQLEGSQIKKNILANIFQSEMYADNMTGHELIRQMHDVDRQLSDLGKKELFDDFGIEIINELPVIANFEKLQRRLIEEFETGSSKDKTTKKLIASLELNSSKTGFAVPLDENAFANQINSAIGSFITKRTVKQKISGGTYVQMSPFGEQRTKRYSSLSEAERNEIDKRVNKKALMAARKKEKGKTKRVQILLPNWFKDLVPGNESMSAAEIGKYVQDNRLLNGIAYRIPNQGMSSIDAFEVVGFLPESMADTVIAYDELTAKTGSDFDIDKMFIMLPEYGIDKKNNRYYYIDPKKYLNKDGTWKAESVDKISDYKKKQILKNRKLELYGITIAHPSAFSQVITPLDSITHKYNATKKRYLQAKARIKLENKSAYTEIENLLTKIDEKKSAENINKFISKADEVLSATKDLEFFSPNYQLETKQRFIGGKFGVGQTARHLVDHSISQWVLDKNGKPYRLSTYIGMGNSYEIKTEDGVVISELSSLAGAKGEAGNLISNTLSGRLNAYVDIAKDPYIFYLNNNRITANTVFMLDRLGVDPTWTDFFISQPSIEKFVEEKIRYESEDRKNAIDDEGRELNAMEAVAYSLGFSIEELKDMQNEVSIDYEVSIEELQNNLDSTKEFSPKEQLKLLIKYDKLSKFASELNKAVSASKADTEGASGGIYEVIVSKRDKENLSQSDKISGFDERFEGTMLGKYFENSIELMDQLFQNKFAVTTSAFEEVFNKLALQTGINPYKDAATLRKLTEHFYGLYMADQLRKGKKEDGTPFYDSKTTPRLFYGENSLAERLKKYQKEGSPIENNSLIQYLTPKTGNTELDPSFITTTRTAVQDSADLNELIDSWQELLVHPDAEVRSFAEDLSVYSFITTGNTSTIFGFSELIPLDFENELFNRIKYQTAAVMPTAPLENPEYFGQEHIETFVRNNLDFPGLVPTVTRSQTRWESKKAMGVPSPKISEKLPKYGFFSSNPNLRLQDGQYNFKKYAKLKNSEGNSVLYTLVGVFQTQYKNKEGREKTFTAPVYAYLPSLGYNRAGKKIVEFRDIRSAVTENLIRNKDGILITRQDALQQVSEYLDTTIEALDAEYKEFKDRGEGISIGYSASLELVDDLMNLTELDVYTQNGVNTLRTKKAKANEHFGNPWSEGYHASTIKVSTVQRAVDNYKDWLLGIRYQDVKPAQRDWILNQIKEGKLDGQKLLYPSRLVTRRKAQGYSHAQALAEVIEEIAANGMPEVITERPGIQERMTAELPNRVSPTAKKHVPKELVKTRIATQYIGDGSPGSSTDRYRIMYEEEGAANTGEYTSDDIIYVSSNGGRPGRVNPVLNGVLQGEYVLVQKAMDAKATIVMDTVEHLKKTAKYNIGEIALANYLADNGYAREDESGIWKPINDNLNSLQKKALEDQQNNCK